MVMAYHSPSLAQEPPNLCVYAPEEETKVTALAEASTASLPIPRTSDEITISM